MTEGRNNTCDSPGGTRRAFLFSVKDSAGLSNYATGPTILTGECTALTLKTGKYAYAFNFEPETAEANSTSTGETVKSSTAYEHKVVLTMAGNTAGDIDSFDRLAKGRTAIIVELNEGSYELFHFESGAKCQWVRDPGKALDDMNGSVLTFISKQTKPAVKISSVIALALLQPES